MYPRGIFIVLGIILMVWCSSCDRKSQYHRLVENELASGERNDSLFLGFYFGMPADDFYAHCWDLNRQGLIREGSGNQTVYWELDQLKHPAAMEFYPGFKDNKIEIMPCNIYYTAWAPWNKELWSDKLLEDVKNMFEKWYGKGFIEVNSKKRGRKAYVKVDGNRQITLFYNMDQQVEVLFTDLTKETSSLNNLGVQL